MRSKTKRNTELKAMATILQTAAELERPVVPLSVEVEDIFDLLDEDILRRHFPRFPGHQAARSEASQSDRSWKTFYRANYNVDVLGRPDIFRIIAAEMRSGAGALEPRWLELRDRILKVADGRDLIDEPTQTHRAS